MKKKIITDITKFTEHAEQVDLKFTEENKKETLEAELRDLIDTLSETEGLLALAAPQIGINKAIIAMKFDDGVHLFVNPNVYKKLQPCLSAETFISMPGKEILTTRPEEVHIAYYNSQLKYEDNKLVGAAARLFDQHYQLLEGVTPDMLGMVTDIEQDGRVADLTEEEFEQVKQLYSQFIQLKTSAMKAEIEKDEKLKDTFKELTFAEKVISGKAAIVEDESKRKAAARNRATTQMMIGKQIADEQKNANRVRLNNFLKKIGK